MSPKHAVEGLFELKQKPGAGLCCVRGCRRPIKPRYPGLGLCPGHYQHRWRVLNPGKSAYAKLRDHAKGRNIRFTISLDYFMGLCDAYCYFEHKAEGFGEYLSIDRRDAARGYEPGNLRIVSVSENTIKGNRERYLPELVQNILDRKREKACRESGTPWVNGFEKEYAPF